MAECPHSETHCFIEGQSIVMYCLLCWKTIDEQTLDEIYEECYREAQKAERSQAA